MPRFHILLPVFAIFLAPAQAWAVSTAPMQMISDYIEHSGCSEALVAWNREYLPRALSGETPATLYYHTLSIRDWGPCGRPYFTRIFSEFQKIWRIYGRGHVTVAQLEAKEVELVKLLLDSVKAGSKGKELVDRYEQGISFKLMALTPDRQFFNCTYFGNEPRCEE